MYNYTNGFTTFRSINHWHQWLNTCVEITMQVAHSYLGTRQRQYIKINANLSFFLFSTSLLFQSFKSLWVFFLFLLLCLQKSVGVKNRYSVDSALKLRTTGPCLIRVGSELTTTYEANSSQTCRVSEWIQLHGLAQSSVHGEYLPALVQVAFS
jgi:hypothetical protein